MINTLYPQITASKPDKQKLDRSLSILEYSVKSGNIREVVSHGIQALAIDPSNQLVFEIHEKMLDTMSNNNTQTVFGFDACNRSKPYVTSQNTFGFVTFNLADESSDSEIKKKQLAIGLGGYNEARMVENNLGKYFAHQTGLGLLACGNIANYVNKGVQNSFTLFGMSYNEVTNKLNGYQNAIGMFKGNNMANTSPGKFSHQKALGLYARNELEGGDHTNKMSQISITALGGNTSSVITGTQFLLSLITGINYTKVNYGLQITLGLKGVGLVGSNYGTMVGPAAITLEENNGKIYCFIKIASKKLKKKIFKIIHINKFDDDGSLIPFNKRKTKFFVRIKHNADDENNGLVGQRKFGNNKGKIFSLLGSMVGKNQGQIYSLLFNYIRRDCKGSKAYGLINIVKRDINGKLNQGKNKIKFFKTH